MLVLFVLTWSLFCGAAAAQVAIQTTSLPDAINGSPYSAQLAASGGVQPYVWSIQSGALAPGLGLNATTGVISGTPATTGSFSFTVQCADSSGGQVPPPAPINLSVTVANGSAASSPIVIAPGTPDTSVGATYSFNFVIGWCPDGSCPMITGGTPPYTVQFVAGSGTLPTGLTLQASGLLVGTPITAGLYNFSIRVIDSLLQTATSDRGINVAP